MRNINIFLYIQGDAEELREEQTPVKLILLVLLSPSLKMYITRRALHVLIRLHRSMELRLGSIRLETHEFS